jgi:hypothetical protein
LSDCQKKVDACTRDVEKVKSESVPDDELVRIQEELEEIKRAEEVLLEELRYVLLYMASILSSNLNLWAKLFQHQYSYLSIACIEEILLVPSN